MRRIAPARPIWWYEVEVKIAGRWRKLPMCVRSSAAAERRLSGLLPFRLVAFDARQNAK